MITCGILLTGMKQRDGRYRVDAVILQGPVSDQDYINWYAEENGMVEMLDEGRELADILIAAGRFSLLDVFIQRNACRVLVVV
jgi:hypothetical protein